MLNTLSFQYKTKAGFCFFSLLFIQLLFFSIEPISHSDFFYITRNHFLVGSCTILKKNKCFKM